MTIRLKMIYLSIIAAVIILGSIIAQIMSGSSNETGNTTHKTRYLSYILADEFRQTSMDLTRLCRTYVSTGEQKHWDAYWVIVKWRSGDIARPDFLNKELYAGKVKPQIEIMKELGFSKKEFALLKEASDNSNGLIATETQAMQSIKEGKIIDGPLTPYDEETAQQFALRIVFDDRYHGEVNKIMDPVNRFFTAIDYRTQTDVDDSSSTSSLWLSTTFIFQLFIGVLFGLFVWNIRLILKQLGGEPKEAVRIANQIANGNLSFDMEGNINEKGTLANALNNMVNSLKQKVGLATKISEGDLSVEVTLSSERDELGKALQLMATNLTDLIRKITGSADTLSNSSEELSSISTQISNATTEMSAQSSTMAGASDEMTSNIATMATGSEEMSANISSISATSTQMSQNISDISDSMAGLSETINSVSTKSSNASEITVQAKEMSESATVIMDELSKSANEIGEVTEIIKEIAQQTNLLALNANIEAASAGEAGKGFAVVANEIKDLAKQSSSSAEAIANKVTDIQKNSEKSGVSMKEISEVISTINNSSNDITKYVGRGAETIDIVVRNMQESTTGVSEIAKLINEMSNTAVDSAKSSAELTQGSNEISKNMGQLDKVVSDTAKGIVQVSSQSKNMNALAEDLTNVVKQFKLQ